MGEAKCYRGSKPTARGWKKGPEAELSCIILLDEIPAPRVGMEYGGGNRAFELCFRLRVGSTFLLYSPETATNDTLGSALLLIGWGVLAAPETPPPLSGPHEAFVPMHAVRRPRLHPADPDPGPQLQPARLPAGRAPQHTPESVSPKCLCHGGPADVGLC